MTLSQDPCKSWLLQKACKGLAVPESLCEALLSEDQAQNDQSNFLKGGAPIQQADFCVFLAVKQPSSPCVTGSGSALLVYVEEILVYTAKASAFSSRNASVRASTFAE